MTKRTVLYRTSEGRIECDGRSHFAVTDDGEEGYDGACKCRQLNGGTDGT